MGVHQLKDYSVIIAFILIALCLFLGLYFGIDDSVKVTEYQQSSQSTKDDEDDCSIVMCSAFGGGIVGDTLALDFMSGE